MTKDEEALKKVLKKMGMTEKQFSSEINEHEKRKKRLKKKYDASLMKKWKRRYG